MIIRPLISYSFTNRYVLINLKIFLESFFLSDPNLKDEVPMEYLSHKERYEHAVRKSCALFKKVDEWQQIDDGDSNSMEVYKYELIQIILKCIYSNF